MSFDSLISVFGSTASTILSLAACLTLFINPIRKKFIQWVKKISRSQAEDEADKILLKLDHQVEILTADIEKQIYLDELQTQALLSLLRNSITHVYYKNEAQKSLREYEAKTLASHIEIYTVLGGNSFVKQLYETMKTWTITD